jgi:protein ImuA
MSALASLRLHAIPPYELTGVWRGTELARQTQATIASGHTLLDNELPGHGWPLGQLTEILQAQPGLHEWRLLLPALRSAVQSGPLVLIGAPHLPNLPALASFGLSADKLLRIDARTPAERLWAAEQTLRCRELGALLAWLPQARAEQLRRLQLAGNSAQGAQALVFALRPIEAQHESSPAPLRVSVQAGEGQGLSVQLLKRRGPPMEQTLQLAAPLPVMAALRRQRVELGHQALKDNKHAVDRPQSLRTERHTQPRTHAAA